MQRKPSGRFTGNVVKGSPHNEDSGPYKFVLEGNRRPVPHPPLNPSQGFMNSPKEGLSSLKDVLNKREKQRNAAIRAQWDYASQTRAPGLPKHESEMENQHRMSFASWKDITGSTTQDDSTPLRGRSPPNLRGQPQASVTSGEEPSGFALLDINIDKVVHRIGQHNSDMLLKTRFEDVARHVAAYFADDDILRSISKVLYALQPKASPRKHRGKSVEVTATSDLESPQASPSIEAPTLTPATAVAAIASIFTVLVQHSAEELKATADMLGQYVIDLMLDEREWRQSAPSGEDMGTMLSQLFHAGSLVNIKPYCRGEARTSPPVPTVWEIVEEAASSVTSCKQQMLDLQLKVDSLAKELVDAKAQIDTELAAHDRIVTYWQKYTVRECFELGEVL